MALCIDLILEEWKADFKNEENRREELKSHLSCIFEMNLQEKDSNNLFEEPMKLSSPKLYTLKSEMLNNSFLANNDDTIFNLESNLQESEQKIRNCKIISRI